MKQPKDPQDPPVNERLNWAVIATFGVVLLVAVAIILVHAHASAGY
jgi:hypothetical protein